MKSTNYQRALFNSSHRPGSTGYGRNVKNQCTNQSRWNKDRSFQCEPFFFLKGKLISKLRRSSSWVSRLLPCFSCYSFTKPLFFLLCAASMRKVFLFSLLKGSMFLDWSYLQSGGVVSLSIPKRGLLGSIHPALGSLSSLRHINLRNNRFSGSLPPELFLARSLKSVVLYGNCLTGRLPSSIGALSFLQVLVLSRNYFSGSVPTSLTQCKRLKSLDLSNNNFTNPLPIGFPSSLLALEKLDLSYNKFNGSIPDEGLGSLPEMVYIDLSYNNLSGPIPQYGALVNRGQLPLLGILFSVALSVEEPMLFWSSFN
ncbi:hypothetical protein HPP92_009461 [Vanilla planifolia]|uniref:Uncharacterized protein n=1 Tax=Vanilla planifolia TaxID=51239 RepID=A0A835RDX3_VANPL|nr:hypothetical protein HPP92_009461 [Vanilla planifolia]